MSIYTQDELDEIEEAFIERRHRAQTVAADYAVHDYITKDGERFGKLGFGRRITVMWKAAESIFNALPLKVDEVPQEDDREKALLYLQSFILHTFGCTDCLCWVWVHEKDVRNKKNDLIGFSEIGIHPKKELRGRLPKALQDHLLNIDAWFEDLKDMRDTMMHRIPLYIPPAFVPERNIPAYNDLSRQIEAAWANRDTGAITQLEAAQNQLTQYAPILSYYSSSARPDRRAEVYKLVLNDMLMIADLGERFMAELRRP